MAGQDYASRLLSGTYNSDEEEDEKYVPSGRDYAAELLSPPPKKIEALMQPSGVDARTGTGKPPRQYQDTGQRSATWGAQFKAGIVDDPETKMSIYAAARFPDMPEEERLSKYEIDNKTGEIYFRAPGPDGQEMLHRETHNTLISKLKKFAAQDIATPATAAGVAATAAGGSGLAIMGAGMAGEASRKALGTLLFDEPRSTWGDIADLTIEGATGAIGAKGGGKGINKLVNRRRIRKAGDLAKVVGEGSKYIDYDASEQMYKQGKKYGVHLFPPQTTRSRELGAGFSLLRDSAASGDIIQKGVRQQAEQVDNAVYKFLDGIAVETDPLVVGDKLRHSSTRALKRFRDIRQKKAQPFYKAALEEDNPDVDVEDIVGSITEEINVSKGDFLPSMKKLRQTFLKDNLPNKTPKIVDKSGKTLTPPTETYETKLAGLHQVKLALDTEIGTLKRAGHKNIARKWDAVRVELLEKMDEASPMYKRARGIYSDASPAVTRAEQGIVGDLSRKTKEKTIQNNVNDLFNNRSPAMVKRARTLIQRESPEAWDKAVRVHMQDTFEKMMSGNADDTGLAGVSFQKALFGTKRKREVLKAALTKRQYGMLTDFMQVLRRTGIGMGGQSMTEPRQQIRKEMQDTLGMGIMKAYAYPLLTYRKIAVDRWNDLKIKKGMRKLADTMMNEKAHKDLRKIKLLSPTTERFMESFGSFLALVGNDYYKEDINPWANKGK